MLQPCVVAFPTVQSKRLLVKGGIAQIQYGDSLGIMRWRGVFNLLTQGRPAARLAARRRGVV